MQCSSLKDFGYDEVKVVGRGQYGKAHLVTSAKESDAMFIAKTIDLTCLSNKERETALQEVDLLRRLDHPNIVEYKDNFFMGDTLVIVMQYCEGGDVANYIKDMARQKMRIRESQVMSYFVQVLQALQYIHIERILHRDLKTSNLFLMKSKSVVKLGDFGISRVLEGSTLAAITVVGTPYYMSPEVCENKPYTFKSDVWALGCVLYELCMLKHAFSADNLLGLVYKIVSDKYEPIPQMYSQALNQLIQRMLEKNAQKRPSVGELLADAYVQGFMNEYVRTKGQYAASKPSAGSADKKHSGANKKIVQDCRSSPPAQGPDVVAAASTTWSPPACAAQSSGPQRIPRKPPRTAPASSPGGGRQSQSGVSGGSRQETPKEAAARRKREAADREVDRLKVAAKQSMHNKAVARRMKEAEFQTTRFGQPKGLLSPTAEAVSLAATSTSGGSMESEGLEEISEEMSGEEYEDDFEDDFCSEDEEFSEVEFGGQVGGVLSTVQEEQDFTRVMANYEQDLARGGGSPVPRRSSSQHSGSSSGPPAAGAAPGSSPGGACSAASGSASGPCGGGGTALDMKARAQRVREDLIHKMGAETFKVAFDFLHEARVTKVDERTVRRQLEGLVGRDVYKQYCFEVDQLVFQHLLYS